MKGLTPDDLLALDEFAARRGELFESHVRYVDRYRRVRIGPRLTLLFALIVFAAALVPAAPRQIRAKARLRKHSRQGTSSQAVLPGEPG